jgi:hypothetical protein
LVVLLVLARAAPSEALSLAAVLVHWVLVQ